MFDFTWLVTAASITGTIANAFKKRWCFVIWMVTNTFWFFYNVHFGLLPQAAVYVVNFVLAVTGLIIWSRDKKKPVVKQSVPQCSEMLLPGGLKLTAQNFGDDPVWRSIDIIITYPDGTSEIVCCADYEEPKKLLRVLAFKQGDNNEPVFSLDYLTTERSVAV